MYLLAFRTIFILIKHEILVILLLSAEKCLLLDEFSMKKPRFLFKYIVSLKIVTFEVWSWVKLFDLKMLVAFSNIVS